MDTNFNDMFVFAADATTAIKDQSTGWSISKFFDGLQALFTNVGTGIAVTLGVAIIIYALFLVAKALWGREPAGGSIIKIVICMVLGGTLVVGGFTWFSKLSNNSSKLVNDLGSFDVTTFHQITQMFNFFF